MLSATPSDFDDEVTPVQARQASEPESESASKPDFESALEQLQQIVGRLERGSGSLESSLSDFETGMSLLRSCYSALAHAEQRIELLTRISTDGKRVETEPFDATATFASAESPPEERRPKGRATKSDSGKAEFVKTESAASKRSPPKKAKPSEPIHIEIKPVETRTTPVTEATSVTEPITGLPGAAVTDNAMTPPFDVSPDSPQPNAFHGHPQNGPAQNTSHGQPPRTPRSPGNLFEIP